MMTSATGSFAVRKEHGACLSGRQAKRMAPACPAGRQSAALTFIEILLVVIIIGALISISLPNLKKTFDDLELKSFARQLQSFMNYLHQRSIIEESIIYLNINPEKKEYWARIKDTESRLKTYPIPPSMRIEIDQQEVLFYPDGSIDRVTIKLINPDNQTIVLTTQGVFGGVKLQPQE